MSKYAVTAIVLTALALPLWLNGCRSADQYPPPASAPATTPATDAATTPATTPATAPATATAP